MAIDGCFGHGKSARRLINRESGIAHVGVIILGYLRFSRVAALRTFEVEGKSIASCHGGIMPRLPDGFQNRQAGQISN